MKFFDEYRPINEERRDEMILFLVDQVEKTSMYAPVLFLLETGTPLSFVLSQLMYGGAPLAEIIVKDGQHTIEEYAQIFEDRRNLQLLMSAIEERRDLNLIEEEKDRLRRKRQAKKGDALSEEKSGLWKFFDIFKRK